MYRSSNTHTELGLPMMALMQIQRCSDDPGQCQFLGCHKCTQGNKHVNVNSHRKTIGLANGTSKNVGLGKFWQDLEISEAFLISLEVSFLHGLFLPFLSLETFCQRVSGSDF